MKRASTKIDMRMNWQHAAQIVAAGLRDGNAEGRQAALQELGQMARVADAAAPLVAVVLKARKRLAGTNIMGQKLDKALVDEIDAALATLPRGNS